MQAQYRKNLLLLALSFSLALFAGCDRQEASDESSDGKKDSIDSQLAPIPPRVKVGAELILQDLAALQGKRIALVGNHTTVIPYGPHLVDTLLDLGLTLTKVFTPEHGFRGDADAGASVKSSEDPKTGLPLVSLYGDNKKPKRHQLAGVDLVLFDLQDVGVRLYTYISTLAYVMEACAEAHIPIIVLDRPNPNGWYIDGPVRQPGLSSFVGLHPIPVVHGMTIGEYAQMINGESWLAKGAKADLQVIPCEYYTHEMRWDDTQLPWIAPSPNLGTPAAAQWYPALVWFEPTPVSVGRGTDSAFTILGAPWFEPSGFSAGKPLEDEQTIQFSDQLSGSIFQFTPRSLPGKATYPKLQDQLCNGLILKGTPTADSTIMQLSLSLMLGLYQQYKTDHRGNTFFKKGFNKWVGNTQLKQDLKAESTVEEMYGKWKAELADFKIKRLRYLLYPNGMFAPI